MYLGGYVSEFCTNFSVLVNYRVIHVHTSSQVVELLHVIKKQLQKVTNMLQHQILCRHWHTLVLFNSNLAWKAVADLEF